MIPLLFFVAINIANAEETEGKEPSEKISNVQYWKAEKQKIEQERKEIKKQIDRTKDINLTNKYNELTAFRNAFGTAIEITEKGLIDNILKQSRLSNHSDPFEKVSLLPGELVPSAYIPFYKEAGAIYGVDWEVLAAIHKIETDFSRHPTMYSSAGAVGHMQFMPPTFAAYGVDGDGDGTRSPWSLQDAIFSAANYLSISGYKKDVRRAIWAYNHADWYVNNVINTAMRIKSQ